MSTNNSPQPTTITLQQCLEAAPWRRLTAIMELLHLPTRRGYRKADLVRILAAHLRQPGVLESIIAQLDAPCYQALGALLEANGALPLHRFQERFGAVEVYRPWRDGEGERPAPWRAPSSSSERLWYLGLVHRWPPRAQPGVVQQMVLPADLRPLLAERLPAAASPRGLTVRTRPGYPPHLPWHMALWLATVAADPIRPLHGRWLPPRVLNALAARTGYDQDPGYRPRRGERHLPTLAFLHHLAQALDLVAHTDPITLTPGAWDWLAAPPNARLRRLWRGWLHAPTALAEPYDFLWEPCPPAARGLVVDALLRLAAHGFVPLPQVVAAARLQDARHLLPSPRPSHWTVEHNDLDPVAELFYGPLWWLGVVDLAQVNDSRATDPATDVPHVRLTATGAWLLDQPDARPPETPDPVPGRIARGAPDVIHISVHASPQHLVRLAPLCTWLAPGGADVGEASAARSGQVTLQLAPDRLARAVAQGVPPAALLQDIAGALARPPSRRERQRWRGWMRAGERVRMRPLLVLETEDAELMAQLRSRKRVRQQLEQVLSPTRVAVEPTGVAALLQTLHTLGIEVAAPHWADLGHEEEAQTGRTDAGDGGAVHESPTDSGSVDGMAVDPGLLWLLLRVYAGLGAHAELPLPVPYSLQERVLALLSPDAQATAESAATLLLEQIERGLAGYLQLPGWQLSHSDFDPWPPIDAALADSHDLQITYRGASGTPTTRRITPYWVETRGGVPYLIAHCHLRGDERVFRVDRIAACQIVSDASDASPPGASTPTTPDRDAPPA